jgi:hypothetical protein
MLKKRGSEAWGESSCEHDFSGSDGDFLGFCGEEIILWLLILVFNNPVFFQ